MKSFFKKLAFVMALAMVVSLAAPAAKSALAATEFAYAYQEGGKVTALNMKAGDEVDLRFIGVTDYKNYTLEWKSSNPQVATVDNKGIVKAVENGTTDIELVVGDGSVYTSTPVKVTVGEEVKVTLGTAGDNTFTTYTLELGKTVDLNFYGVPNFSVANYTCTWVSSAPEIVSVDTKGILTPVAAGTAVVTVAIVNNITGDTLTVVPVEVTVPAPVVELTYEVKQVSDTKATLTFNGDITFTKSDVVLARVYDGDIEVAWPLKNVTIKDNVITIEPYVAFADGDKYIVKVGAEDEGVTFTTVIGEVDRIETTFKSLDKEGRAFTNGEDGDDIEIKFTSKLYSKGVDVTAVYKDVVDIVYTLSAENEYVMLDEYEGTMVISKAGIPVTVAATCVYYDDDDNEHKETTFASMTSEMAPAYAVTGVKAWTILAPDQTKVDWTKTVHSIPAYDEGYSIAALITDNYGNTVCTVDGLKHNDDKIKDLTGSRMALEGYEFKYSSANVEKLLVGEDGSLTTYVSTTIPAILGMYNSEKENPFVRNLSAMSVTVKDERKVNKVVVKDSSITLVTDGDYTKEKVKITIEDQYGVAWDENVTLDVTCNVANTTGLPGSVTYVANKGVEVELDGNAIGCTKSTFTLTFKDADSGKSANLKVSLKDPKYEADGKTIKTTSYSLSATGVDQYIKTEDDGTVKKASVMFYTLSNGYKVGTVAETTVKGAEGIRLVTSADDLKQTTATAAKGDWYLVVYAPNGSIVGAATSETDYLGIEGSNGAYDVVVAKANRVGEMRYAATGTYTVKVLAVSSFNKKEEAVFTTKYSTSFKVENTNKDVKFKSQETLTTEETNIDEIVVDTLKFTLGGADWDIDASMIAGVKYVENKKAGHIVITSVTFKVPLNGSDDDTFYVVKNVTVNKSIKVPDGFGWKSTSVE